MKSIMTASLTCHDWLRASNCLAISKRICLNINKIETIILFRNTSKVHRRFCTVKVNAGSRAGSENFYTRDRALKLDTIWRKYSNDIHKIIFYYMDQFCAISNALKILKRLESVEIRNCKISGNKFKNIHPKCKGNENITSLVLDKSCFSQYHVNYLLSLTPNLTSIDWNNCARLESKCLFTFLAENPLKLKKGLEFIEHIRYVTYPNQYQRKNCKIKELLYRNFTPI